MPVRHVTFDAEYNLHRADRSVTTRTAAMVIEMPQTEPREEEYPHATTAEDFARNLAAVNARIATACQRVGRDPAEVRLLPVSKTVDEGRMRSAYAAGCRAFGENKVQEARDKSQAMADLDIAWSVIGHLQTNKAKYVARFAAEFQALASLEVADVLDRRLQAEGRGLDVFVQVNSSDEDSKYGLAPADVLAFARELPAYSSLKVRGLMTLAVFSKDESKVRHCFERMRRVREQLRQDGPDRLSFDELSMGMSGDFEIAIEEGSSVVRVGQAIFGQRALPDSHYWPGGAA